MSGCAEANGAPTRDRALVLYDLLEQIAWLKAVGRHPAEVERLVEELGRLRAVL